MLTNAFPAMKIKMSERSLFAVLLRSPWWISFAVMAAVALVAGALLPEAYKVPGMLGSFPFLVIGMMAAWRQRKALSQQRIDALVEQARRMAWREFAELLTHALRQQGFVVTPLGNGPADFRIEKQGRITLVSAKRWKAATVGVDHLHELLTEAEAQDTKACSCISLGSFSPAAIKLAHDRQVQLLGAADIAQLMHDGSVA